MTCSSHSGLGETFFEVMISYLVAAADRRENGLDLMVDLGPHGAVTDLRVNVVCEIERRSPLRQRARVALGREHDDLGRVETKLEIVQKLDGVLRRTVQRLADLLHPAVELSFLLRQRVGLVLPVRGESPLGDLLHALRADLHLGPNTVGPHDRRVERLVPVRLRNVDPVADTVGLRLVDVRHERIDVPALRFLGNQRRGLEHDTDREYIVDLLERNVLALHLRPDRVDRLDAARYLEIDVVRPKLLDDRGVELLDETRPLGFRFPYFVLDLTVIFRKAVLQRQILQLALDREQTETIGQRREQIDRLAGDLHLLVRRHRAERSHVVQPVGDLDQNHAYVVGERKQHLAEILGLFRRAGLENPRHLGQSVDHQRDLRAETALDILYRIVGILDHVVQQRGDDRLDSEPDLVHDDPSDGQRMQDIRLPRATAHALVGFLRQKKSPLDQIRVVVVLAYLRAGRHQLVELLAYDTLVFVRISHSRPFISTIARSGPRPADQSAAASPARTLASISSRSASSLLSSSFTESRP